MTPKWHLTEEIYSNMFFEIREGFSKLYTNNSPMEDQVAAVVVYKTAI